MMLNQNSNLHEQRYRVPSGNKANRFVYFALPIPDRRMEYKSRTKDPLECRGHCGESVELDKQPHPVHQFLLALQFLALEKVAHRFLDATCKTNSSYRQPLRP